MRNGWVLWAMEPERQRKRQKRLVRGALSVLALGAALLAVGTVRAEQKPLMQIFSAMCLPGDKALKALEEKLNQSPVWRGVVSDGDGMVVYQTDGGTWTALFLKPDGRACIFAGGEDGQAIKLVEKPDA